MGQVWMTLSLTIHTGNENETLPVSKKDSKKEPKRSRITTKKRSMANNELMCMNCGDGPFVNDYRVAQHKIEACKHNPAKKKNISKAYGEYNIGSIRSKHS